MIPLESYFQKFRENTIGVDAEIETPFGKKKLLYADWIASGRLYRPIEEKLTDYLGVYIGNPHTDSNVTAATVTELYHQAYGVIKKHVNASSDDVLIPSGFGMTEAVNKLQRILGLRINNTNYYKPNVSGDDRPVVFVTKQEHHSNHTSWLTTVAEVVLIDFDEHLQVDANHLESLLKKYNSRKLKIGSFSAASNVTGIKTNYHQLAKLMHQYGGYAFVDFAASAPYVPIDMHPSDEMERLDAIFFSPHKFLGGPGSAGILIFNKSLYHNEIPDKPGGGTVTWTNPWGEYAFFNDIELREDGGTPGFMELIKVALAIRLKEQMTCDAIAEREDKQIRYVIEKLSVIDKVHVLAGDKLDRIGAVSFTIDGIHYNLLAKLLNDHYGIQVRGGCACAGTYGHVLLDVDREKSKRFTDAIDRNDLSNKPGFIRFSLHPIMSNGDLEYSMQAIEEIVKNIDKYKQGYIYHPKKNEFYFGDFEGKTTIGFFEL